MGTNESQFVFDPLSASLGDLPAAERYLSGFRIEDAIAGHRESNFIRAAERRRGREFDPWRASLESDLHPGFEKFEDIKTDLAVEGGGNALIGVGRRARNLGLPPEKAEGFRQSVDEFFDFGDGLGGLFGSGGGSGGGSGNGAGSRSDEP